MGRALNHVYYITTPFRARKKDSKEKRGKKNGGACYHNLTIYSFGNFLHKIVDQYGTLCILSGQPLFATFDVIMRPSTIS